MEQTRRRQNQAGSDGPPPPNSDAAAPAASADGAKGTIRVRDIVRHLKLEYTYSKGAEDHKMIDRMMRVLELGRAQKPDVNLMLQEAASIINRQFLIRQVTIGLRSDGDGLYRYVAMSGLSDRTWAAHRRLAYSLKDFVDDKRYPSHAISKYTKIFFIEDEPYAQGEEDTYDRSLSIGTTRNSLTDSREGDYLDTYILGRNEDMLGWIEYSGTWSGTLPDAITVKWIEAIASMMGVILQSGGGGSSHVWK